MADLDRTEYTVSKLVDMFRRGDIAIPEIQRDFVWDANRIHLLLDSIMKDYPSGAIILWKPPFRTRSEFEILIRPERLHLYAHKLPKYLLLDGQQRLTALSSVILPANEVMESIGEEIYLPNLFINLKKPRDIQPRKDLIPPSGNHILLNRLLSQETDDSGLASVLNEIAARRDISKKHVNELTDFRKAILDYAYPVQILDGHDYQTVAEIFKRVNKQGRPLVTAEIELATIIPHWRGFSKLLRNFMKEMSHMGFKADLSFYLKSFAFISTNSPAINFLTKRIAGGDLTTADLTRHWRLTERAIRKMQKVLSDHAIDRTELITTRNALVPIVFAIAKDRRRRISEGTYIKWLIYAMAGMHYTQQSEGVLKGDSYFLTEPSVGIERGFLKMTREMVKTELAGITRFMPSEFSGIGSKNPALLFVYLSLRHLGALDFTGNNAPPVEQISPYQIHHIFPYDFMINDDEARKWRKSEGFNLPEFRQQINDVANLTFLSVPCNQEIKQRSPSDYLLKMTTEENLKAHCIPTEPDLWNPRNYGKFCEQRRHLLAKAMNSYMKGLE